MGLRTFHFLAMTVLLGFTQSYAQNIISGQIYYDINEDCTQQGIEPTMPYWPVTLNQANHVFHSLTTASGQYSFNVPDGVYNLTVHPLSPNFFEVNPCVWLYEIELNSGAVVALDVPVLEELGCAETMVDLVMLESLPGDTARMFLSYLNTGSADFNNTSVQLETGRSFNAPYSLNALPNYEGSDLITILLDQLPVGAPISRLELLMEFANSPEEDNLVYADLSAPIDHQCLNPTQWDSSNVVVSGECIAGDSTQFKIRNLGPGNMQTPSDYIIVEDDLLIYDEDQFQLNAGDSLVITFEDPASFHRITADQTANNPILGQQTVQVDVCSGFSAPLIAPGDIYIPDPTVSHQKLNHFTLPITEPAILEVYPRGVLCDDGSRRILYSDRLDFTLRARNPHSTQGGIQFEMPLPTQLDQTTFRPGASSDSYLVKLINDTLKWTMSEQLYPNAWPNQSDQAVVKFSMKLDTLLPLSYPLETYFHVNIGGEPYESNHVLQNVGAGLDTACLIIGLDETVINAHDIVLFPNPANNMVRIGSDQKVLDLKLYSMDGKLIASEFSHNRLNLESLENGIYIVSIRTDAGVIRKKLMVQH